jgi:poly(3-hydroxybutyrate) depolymerase
MNTCPYEVWKSWQNHFKCRQTKPVPILIINGELDKVNPIKGAFYKNELEQKTPMAFATRFFRERYGCGGQIKEKELEEIYRRVNPTDKDDYTVCTRPRIGSSCHTEVV